MPDAKKLVIKSEISCMSVLVIPVSQRHVRASPHLALHKVLSRENTIKEGSSLSFPRQFLKNSNYVRHVTGDRMVTSDAGGPVTRENE